MEFGTKNKLLKAYGKGLAEKIYRASEQNVEISSGATFRGTFDNYLGMYLNSADGLKNKDRNLVIEGLAEGFLEKGLLTDAYDLYKVSNPKKAKLIHRLLKFDL